MRTRLPTCLSTGCGDLFVLANRRAVPMAGWDADRLFDDPLIVTIGTRDRRLRHAHAFRLDAIENH
jgi:hypothetical protein